MAATPSPHTLLGPSSLLSGVSTTSSFPEGAGLETRVEVGEGRCPQTALVFPWPHPLQCPSEGAQHSMMHLVCAFSPPEIFLNQVGSLIISHTDDS